MPFIIVGGAVPQLSTAVGTVEQAGEHTHDAGPGGPAAVLAKVLDKGKCLPVNDSGMGVGEHFPFLLRPVQLRLLLERLPESTEVHCIAHVFLPV